MKKRYLILILLIALVLTACGKDSAKNEATEEIKPVEQVKKVEEQPPVEEPEVDHMKDIRVVAGTVEIVRILEKLGYENVYAIPEGIEDTIYKDAIVFGPEDNPDPETFYEHRNTALFILDGSVVHAPEFCGNVGMTFVAPIRNLENFDDKDETLKNSIIAIAERLGLKNKAIEMIENNQF
ncbi:MAG: hypothetical protein Q4P29_01535 [Tissierellia bacterium]|nr:hypothetical protein [Tissierellia bacterium]